MKKIFLLLTSVFFSTMMFSQVLLWKDGEVIYQKNINEVDKISFYEVEDFAFTQEVIELDLYGSWSKRRNWVHVEFTPKNSYATMLYSSSDENVVTVSYDGHLIARGVGEATITARIVGSEIEKTCKVVVNGFQGTLDLPDYVDMIPGTIYKFSYYNILDPACFDCMENLEWSSMNEDVATVSEDGVITALAVGEAIVTAKMKGTKLTSSTIVRVNDPLFVLYDSERYEPLSASMALGVGTLKSVEVHFSNENLFAGQFEYEWISSNEEVVTFARLTTNDYSNRIVALSLGEAEVTVKVKGTDIECKVKVVVKATDPMSVKFYDVLWRDNQREYPLGYDYDGDGVDDVVREIDLWLLGDNLNWVEEDSVGKTVGEDYFIFVSTACVYTGTSYYALGGYSFYDNYYEDDYSELYEGERYLRPLAAVNSYFNSESYCRYYEQYYTTGEYPNADDFLASYGWWLKNESSYIYYWNTATEEQYIAGLVNWGSFELNLNESSRGTTALCVSYMDLSLSFFAEDMGFAKEVDAETGELKYKVPFEMAPYVERNVYSSGYRAPQQKAPVKQGGISEKALKANQLLNLPLQMKLKSFNF